MFRSFCIRAALVVLLVACSQAALQAAELARLPNSPANWMNSAPLSLEQLQGKGIVVWYFEEQCPSCEKKWPAILEMAEKHRDKPVVFIAVNSGESPTKNRRLSQTKSDSLAGDYRPRSLIRTRKPRCDNQLAKHLRTTHPHRRWKVAQRQRREFGEGDRASNRGSLVACRSFGNSRGTEIGMAKGRTRRFFVSTKNVDSCQQIRKC